GRVRALIVSGGNPIVAWPDDDLTMRALRDLELLVVIDHRMTSTAELAHAVIPPRLSLERADVPHVMDRWFPAPYTNYTQALVAEPADDTSARFTVAPPDIVEELAELRVTSAFDDAHPFRLVSRRLKSVLNSAGTTAGTNHAYLHPDDMTELGVREDELVTI